MQYACSSPCGNGFSIGAVALLGMPTDGARLSLSLFLSLHWGMESLYIGHEGGLGLLWGVKVPHLGKVAESAWPCSWFNRLKGRLVLIVRAGCVHGSFS